MGANCFLNHKVVQKVNESTPTVELSDAGIVNMGDLGGGNDGGVNEGGNISKVYVLCKEPKIVAVPGFLSAFEAEYFLDRVVADEDEATGPFRTGTQTLQHVSLAESNIIADVEARLCSVASLPLRQLAGLRLVHVGTTLGFCNRGFGPKSAYICLSERDDVFFAKLGIRIKMRRGDALFWPNTELENPRIEEVRTLRVHLPSEGAPRSIGIDVLWHDNPVREQQANRQFTPDSGPPDYMPVNCS